MFTAVQWNIGGGLLRGTLASDDLAFEREDLASIAESLRRYGSDIVTLQEVHESAECNQAEVLAGLTGLPYFYSKPLSHSHLDVASQSGLAILSRWPLTDLSFHLFPNPHVQKTQPSGRVYTTFDKGALRAAVQLPNGQQLHVATLHALPFTYFGLEITGPGMQAQYRAIETACAPTADPWLLQGDFNCKCASLGHIVPQLFSAGALHVPLPGPTEPGGDYNDHALYRGLRLIGTEIDYTALTDHYPVVSRFE